MTPRRARMIVRALHDAGMLDCVRETETVGGVGQQAAEWTLSAAARALPGPPVLIGDRTTGNIIGVRPAADGAGNEALRRAVERAALPVQEAARRLRVSESTLSAIIHGSTPIGRDDPILDRARSL